MGRMKEFEIMVSEDIKGKGSQADKDYLRLPENWQTWKESLIVIIETVSAKIEDLEAEIQKLRSAYPDFDTDPAASYEESRGKAARFRFHAEKRLAEVDRLIRLGEEPNEDDKLVYFLRDAIITHKRIKEEKSESITDTDQALWKTIQGKWSF
jgi:hypothetical protein|tara:strand:- start:3320 stop:3778 length:459 start_codon:yes stop_codon:yes gene_type:complete